MMLSCPLAYVSGIHKNAFFISLIFLFVLKSFYLFCASRRVEGLLMHVEKRVVHTKQL